MAHKTDYKDALFAKRKYRQTNNTDGTVSFEDATEYTQEGDRIGAKYCNEIGAALNALEKPTFSQAATRANINSGESMPTILGKVKKWFADLGTAAFYAVANNCTTTAAGSVLDARQGKTLMDNYNQLNSKLQPKPAGTYEKVTSSYTATKDGWMIYTLVAKGAESNAGIDDSLGNRIAYVASGITIMGMAPVQSGVTYTSFAAGSGSRVDMRIN